MKWRMSCPWRVRHQLVGDTGLYLSHLSRQEQCGLQEEVDCPLWEKSGNDAVVLSYRCGFRKNGMKYHEGEETKQGFLSVLSL